MKIQGSKLGQIRNTAKVKKERAPKRKSIGTMTLAELEEALITYTERWKYLESKKSVNGGPGMLTEQSTECHQLKNMKIPAVTARINEIRNGQS
jgi:hypothetical protein